MYLVSHLHMLSSAIVVVSAKDIIDDYYIRLLCVADSELDKSSHQSKLTERYLIKWDTFLAM